LDSFLNMKVTNIAKHLGKILGFALLIAIFVMVFGVYWQITQGENADYKDVKAAIIQYGSDLNEMREYLYLPQNEYAFFQSDSEMDLDQMEAPEDNRYQEGVMTFAETLAKSQALLKQQEEAKVIMNAWLNDAEFNQSLADLNLRLDGTINVDEDYGRMKVMQGDQAVIQTLLDLETQNLSAQSIRGIESISLAEGGSKTGAILDYLEGNTDDIVALKLKIESQKTAMTGLLQDEAIQKILQQNTLKLNLDPVGTPAGFEYYITDLDDSPVLTIVLKISDATLEMEGMNYLDTEAIKDPLLEILKTLNGETDQIKMIREKELGLAEHLKSEAFLETGLKASEAQNEEVQIVYDLFYTDTEALLGQIIFDRLTGEIRFREANGELDYSLDDILSGSKKKP